MLALHSTFPSFLVANFWSSDVVSIPYHLPYLLNVIFMASACTLMMVCHFSGVSYVSLLTVEFSRHLCRFFFLGILAVFSFVVSTSIPPYFCYLFLVTLIFLVPMFICYVSFRHFLIFFFSFSLKLWGSWMGAFEAVASSSFPSWHFCGLCFRWMFSDSVRGKNFISAEGFVLLFQCDANQNSHLEGDELNPCVLTQLL